MTRSPSATELRIGVVGCGRAAATLHLPALARVAGARVVALSDTDPARLEALGARLPDARAHPDYHDLVRDDGVDLVAVCTPAAHHLEIATAALRAGRHCFVEKPLALALADCDRLVAEARRAASDGSRSVVGFNLRSHRLLRQARAIVAAGTLGEIEAVRSLWSADWSGATRPAWHATRAGGGGALLEIGTHLADLWRWLLASEVDAVQAMSRSTATEDQTAVLQARMRSGALATGIVSQRTVSHNIHEILGSRGTLRLSLYHGDSLELTPVGGASGGALRRLQPLLQRAARLPAALRAARGGGDYMLSYVHEWRRIVAALASGEPMPATVEDGRQAAAVTLAALQSAAGGGLVVPAPPPGPMLVEPRAG